MFSEQKLIRQKVDVIPINATVETEDGLRVPVKLLDCDTISQAKEKLLDTLFKAAPVSQRPRLTEVDLGKGTLDRREKKWRLVRTWLPTYFCVLFLVPRDSTEYRE